MSQASVAEADRLAIGWAKESTYGEAPTLVTVTASDISWANSDNSVNTAAGDFVAAGFLAGQHLRGYGTANNAGKRFTIESVATGKMVLGERAVTDESSGASMTLRSGELETTRYTSESFRQETATTESNEVDPTAMVTDIIRTGVDAPGDLNFEFSGETFDEQIKAALRALSWSLTTRVVTSITTLGFTAPNQIDDSANGLAGAVVNEWIRVTTASGVNDGFYKVASVAAGRITVDQMSITTELAAAAGSSSIEMGGSIVNGTTCQSYFHECQYTDLTNIFKNLPGSVPNSLSLDVPQEGILTGSLSFVCRREVSGTAKANGSNVAANSNDVMNSLDDVEVIYESDAAYAVTGATMQTNSNVRARKNVGDLGASSIGLGKFNAAGTHSAFFADATVMNRYLNFSEFPIAYVFLDDEGFGYVFDFPAVKYTSGQRNGTGVNTDIQAEMGWSAKKDGTEAIMMRVSRFGVY